MSKNDFALYKNLCGKVSLSGGETLEVYREGKWLTHSVFQHNVNCCFFFLLATEDGNDDPICETTKETQIYRTDFWTLWEKARVG